MSDKQRELLFVAVALWATLSGCEGLVLATLRTAKRLQRIVPLRQRILRDLFLPGRVAVPVITPNIRVEVRRWSAPPGVSVDSNACERVRRQLIFR